MAAEAPTEAAPRRCRSALRSILLWSTTIGVFVAVVYGWTLYKSMREPRDLYEVLDVSRLSSVSEIKARAKGRVTSGAGMGVPLSRPASYRAPC